MTMTTGRAESKELGNVFLKYASVQKGEEWYMSPEDFVCRYLKLVDSSNTSPEVIQLLAEIGDTSKDRLISLSEFRSLEGLLCTPDATSRLAFLLFDIENKGQISFENFQKVLGATVTHKAVPFNFDSTFVKQYFGKNKKASLNYHEFTQLLQSLPTEHARQAFVSRDKDNSGSLPALEFVALMKDIRGFKMSSYIQENLLSVAGGSVNREVTYPYFKAFNQFLGNLNILEKVVQGAVSSSHDTKATQAQLLKEAQSYAQITPLQISLLYELCSMDNPSSGAITMESFSRLLPQPPRPIPLPVTVSTPSGPGTTEVNAERAPWFQALEPVYRFALGAMAGATGATVVYPIDLVKTRLQNQRGSLAGEIMYKNSFDCFWKVVRGEGVAGLYRGLLPQLVGVSPEKAIKLAANDTMRDVLRYKDGSLPLWRECIAGGCGGMCQVMFTNPLEIVKIRLQVAGEMAQTTRIGALHVIKELGFMGLYKGASACFLRDIPFSAIYFPTYAHLKAAFTSADGNIGVPKLFLAGFIAGVPAAGLLTPADVIKTRLQVKARKGQQTYNGLFDCFRKVLRAEGPRAFWKGAPARIFRSSPQFGVTLATYEFLKKTFPVNFKRTGSSAPKDVPTTSPLPEDFTDHIGGYKLAHSTFSAVENRYGLVFVDHTRRNQTAQVTD